MNITLLNSKVDKLLLLQSDEIPDEMEFSVSTAFSTDELDRFLVVFNIKLQADSEHMIELRHLSQFKADIDIKEEDRESPFFSINAPAIAYPFLRAYVANLMLNSGFEPAMLPTINFVNLAKK